MTTYAKGNATWSIVQHGAVLEIVDAGKLATRKFVTAQHAATQHAKLVAEKLWDGYVEQAAVAAVAAIAAVPVADEPRDANLDAAIRAEPTDRAAFAVYADWLSERGHPRGELIALQLAEEDAPRDDKRRVRVARHLAKHVRPLLGAIAARLPERGDHQDGALVWRRGFIHAVTLAVDDAEPAETLDAILAHPSGRLVESITVGTGRRSLAAVCAVIAARAPALRELSIDGHAGELGALWAAVPQLRVLSVIPRAVARPRGDYEDGPDVAPASPASIASLAAVSWPQLERLDLGCEELAPEAVALVAPSVLRAAMPKLATLRLRSRGNIGAVVDALIAGPLAAQLELVDLGWSAYLDTAGAKRLVANRASFPRVRTICVRANGAELAALRDAFPRIEQPRVQTPDIDDAPGMGDDDDERYDEIDE